GTKQHGPSYLLCSAAGLDIHIHGIVDRLLGFPQGQRTLTADLASHLLGGIHYLGSRYDHVDQADPISGLSIKEITGEYILLGYADGGMTRHPLGSSATGEY